MKIFSILNYHFSVKKKYRFINMFLPYVNGYSLDDCINQCEMIYLALYRVSKFWVKEISLVYEKDEDLNALDKIIFFFPTLVAHIDSANKKISFTSQP